MQIQMPVKFLKIKSLFSFKPAKQGALIWLIRGVFVLVIFLELIGVAALQFGLGGRAIHALSRVVPYPVALVDGKIIRYSDYQDDLKTLRYFFAKQKANGANFAELENLEGHILERMIRNEILDKIAKERGVVASQNELEAAFEDLAAEAGSPEKAAQSLKELYGWDVKTFEQKVLRVFVIQDRLARELVKDEKLNAEARAEAESVKDAARNGADFAELAKEKSDDSGSAMRGGDLGFFGRGMMVEEFEQAAFALSPGEVSEVITSPFGHHVIKVEEVKKEKEEVKEVRARHILIRTKNLDEFLNEEIGKAKIYRFLRAPKVS